MNILVFAAYFYPHTGGMEKFVQELFSEMKDVKVTIVTCNTENSKPFEEKFGFKIYRLDCWNMVSGSYPVVKPSGWKQLEALDKEHQDKEKFDYVITNTRFFNTSFVGLKFARHHNIPLIHIEHGSCHTKSSNPIVSLINVVYDHTIGKKIIKQSDKVVCISKSAQEFVKHLYNRKTLLVHNSINTKEFGNNNAKIQNKLRKDLGIKKEKIIIFVGRLIYAKGVQDLLEATKYTTNIKVLIIGDGNYASELKKRYSDKKHNKEHKKYVFLGQKTGTEIARYMSIADLFVNPSYSEGLPTSVLEAGAARVPVIATDVGGTREIIDDGKNGYLINPASIPELEKKIVELLKDRKKADRFGRELQKKTCAEFDWSISRKKFMDILKDP